MAKTRSSRAKRPTASRRRSSPAKSAGRKGQRGRAPASSDFRVRVRMYRHGLGDCFLVTFRRAGRDPFQLLIDFIEDRGWYTKVSNGERLSATGFPCADTLPFARRVIETDPDRVLWGTDWPHPNYTRHKKVPNDCDLLELFYSYAPEPEDEAIPVDKFLAGVELMRRAVRELASSDERPR